MIEPTLNEHEHGGGIPPLGFVALVLFLLLAGYGFLVSQGIPQNWTEQAVHAEAAVDHNEAELYCKRLENVLETTPAPPQEGNDDSPPVEGCPIGRGGLSPNEHFVSVGSIHHPPFFMVAPFAILLLAIAILPLIPAAAHWWESNLHKFYVAAGLGVATLLYYGLGSDFTLAGHWPAHYEVSADAAVFDKISVIFINAIVADFIPFIILLFSLFTITGGIRIEGNLKASPLVNSVILFIGAVLASFIGTTGAAMLMIRLLLETNRERKYKAHTVVFFIFCVCNCGGCLTPLGDPPLFLGYLKGVDFFWTFHLWKEWAFINGTLIGIYFLWDTVWYYRREHERPGQHASRE